MSRLTHDLQLHVHETLGLILEGAVSSQWHRQEAIHLLVADIHLDLWAEETTIKIENEATTWPRLPPPTAPVSRGQSINESHSSRQPAETPHISIWNLEPKWGFLLADEIVTNSRTVNKHLALPAGFHDKANRKTAGEQKRYTFLPQNGIQLDKTLVILPLHLSFPGQLKFL